MSLWTQDSSLHREGTAGGGLKGNLWSKSSTTGVSHLLEDPDSSSSTSHSSRLLPRLPNSTLHPYFHFPQHSQPAWLPLSPSPVLPPPPPPPPALGHCSSTSYVCTSDRMAFKHPCDTRLMKKTDRSGASGTSWPYELYFCVTVEVGPQNERILDRKQ